jgi:predicted RNA-binding Zn ribbon-like protein
MVDGRYGSTPRIRAEMPRLIGGRLCLDFANTAGGRGGESPDEFLGDYRRLVSWAEYVGLAPERTAVQLYRVAEQYPDAAAEVYRTAIALRETIYRIFAAFGRGESPAATDFGTLQQQYITALAHAQLEAAGGKGQWTWSETSEALEQILWPIAHSAVELVTCDELARVRECPGAGGPCTWLFLDMSKAGRRRWCSMAECGGVAKARRQTMRRRGARARTAEVSVSRRQGAMQQRDVP